MKNFRLDFWKIMTIAIIVIFALFLIYPLISLFADGFRAEGTGDFTLANFQRFFSKKYYYRALTNSLKLTVAVTICSLLIGVPLGAIAGSFGGWIDDLLMRITDVFLSFPPLLLAIVLVALLGSSLTNAILAIAISW